MTDETLKKIQSLGSLGYPADKCANVLELTGEDRAKFLADFKNPKSEIAQVYQIGIDIADFEIDAKLLQLAKTGDAKSIQLLETRKKKHRMK